MQQLQLVQHAPVVITLQMASVLFVVQLWPTVKLVAQQAPVPHVMMDFGWIVKTQVLVKVVSQTALNALTELLAEPVMLNTLKMLKIHVLYVALQLLTVMNVVVLLIVRNV